MGFMLSIVSIGNLIMQSAINDLGENVITSHLLARKVDSLFMIPLSTVAASASTFASQNYGANEMQRIKKGLLYNILLGFLWSIISIIILYSFGRYFIMWLGSVNNEEIIKVAFKFIKWNCPFFMFLGILLITRNFMQSIGFKIIPIVSSFIELFIKLLVTFIFKPIFGYDAILISECIIWALCAIVLMITFMLSKQGKEIIFNKKTLKSL